MSQKKPLPRLTLGNRLPYRFLEILPQSWKHRYLLRQSGGDVDCGVFDLSKKLQALRRLLIVWPERVEEMLLAVPTVKALSEALGNGATCAHFAEVRTVPFLSGLFPAAPLVGWDRGSLAWHEPAVQTALASLRAFHPDAAICWLNPFPSVLQAVVKASGAGIRIAFESVGTWPYANVEMAPDAENPLPARYFHCLALWRYAGFSPQEKWARIQSDAEQRRDAADKWAGALAQPEQTWLYLHLSDGQDLDDALHAQLSLCLQAHEAAGFRLGWVEWAAAASGPGEGAWRGAPSLQASGWSNLLALIEGVRGVLAFQGAALHFASLAEVRCLALLRRSEAAYDASRWNRLFQPAWV